MQNFRLTVLTFRVTFTPLTCCVSRDLKFSLNQFQAAELNWRQFNTKRQMKSAPKSPPTEAGCNPLELPLVFREQFFRRLVGYVFLRFQSRCESSASTAAIFRQYTGYFSIVVATFIRLFKATHEIFN